MAILDYNGKSVDYEGGGAKNRDCPYSFSSASVSINLSEPEGEWSVSISDTFKRVRAPKFGNCNDKKSVAPKLAYREFSLFSPCCDFGRFIISNGGFPSEPKFIEDSNGNIVTISVDEQKRALAVGAGSIKYSGKTYPLIGWVSWSAGHAWLRRYQPIPHFGPKLSEKAIQALRPFNFSLIPSLTLAKINIDDVTKRGDVHLGTDAPPGAEQKIYFSGGNGGYGTMGVTFNETIIPGDEITQGGTIVNYIEGVSWGSSVSSSVTWKDPDGNNWIFGFGFGPSPSSYDAEATSGGYISETPEWPEWDGSKKYKQYDFVTYKKVEYEAVVDIVPTSSSISTKIGGSNPNPSIDFYDELTNPEGRWKNINYSDHIQITGIAYGIRIGFIKKFLKAGRINLVKFTKPKEQRYPGTSETFTPNILCVPASNTDNTASINFNTVFKVPEQSIPAEDGGGTIPEFWSDGPGGIFNPDIITYSDSEGQINVSFTQTDEFETGLPTGGGSFNMNGNFSG